MDNATLIEIGTSLQDAGRLLLIIAGTAMIVRFLVARSRRANRDQNVYISGSKPVAADGAGGAHLGPVSKADAAPGGRG
jgi:hypothetical protein